MSRPKQIAAVALSVAGLASLAACGGNDGSSGLTSTSSTATSYSSSTTGSAGPTSSSTTDKTSTPTATGARVNIPEAATKKTDAGAKAFAAYYSKQWISAYLKGDPSVLDGLHGEGCGFCKGTERRLREMKGGGLHYESPNARISILGTGGSKYENEVSVAARVTELPARKVDRAGRAHGRHDAVPPFRAFFVVAWNDGEWRLAEVVQP